MDRRHTWASALIPTVLARRLWARFEILPFRRGMALLVGTLAVVGLLVVGVISLGGGSDEHTVATPGRPHRTPVEAAAPPAPTWGAYVPPRPADPAPVRARPLVTSVPERPKPTHASPRPATSCPASLKKWPWVWEVCKRKQSQ